MKPSHNTRLVMFLYAMLFAAPSVQAFYNSSTGRWLSRDPIEDLGLAPAKATELNHSSVSVPQHGEFEMAYGFVRNAPTTAIDLHGLKTYIFGWYGAGSRQSKGNLKLKSMADAVRAIEVFYWDMDITGPARIKEAIKGDPCPIIKLFGWSWGGVTALRVAKKLGSENISVDTLFTFDPVFLFRGGGRAVPDNVLKAFNYYQTSFSYEGSALFGDQIVDQRDMNPDGTRMVVVEGVRVPINHATILWAAEVKFILVMYGVFP